MTENFDVTSQIDRIERQIREIGTVRRLIPQIIVTVIKNLIILNKSCFDGLSPIAIPALLGISIGLNPNEAIHIAPEEVSWLSSLTFIGHPFGSLFLSGCVSDALGRKKALMVIVAPAVLAFIMLGMANSFLIVCLGFFFLSFIFGLKDAPSVIYIAEAIEPSVRGTLLSFTPLVFSLGQLLVNLLGTFLSWRQVTLIISVLPVLIVIAIYFIPETPNWLLSKGRSKDAQRSLQWLRGWVTADAVRDEFTRLQNHSILSNACALCTEQSIKCYHPSKASFCDKFMELKRKRTLKPFILVIGSFFFAQFSSAIVMRAYIIQILKAYGMSLDANVTLTILSSMSLAGCICFTCSVKMLGKRRLYLCSTAMVVLCSIGLSAYGFILFPSNWSSFKNPSDSSIPNFKLIRHIVGNYSYFALALLIAMHFFTTLGPHSIPMVINSEVFSFKSRSFLCGLTLGTQFLFGAIATKTYYNIEMWLTLPGAILFYGMISFIGLITMYFILPETEQRTLEDIELHYADDTKKITDIHIPMRFIEE